MTNGPPVACCATSGPLLSSGGGSGAAGQLLPQRGELLVTRERAAGLRRCTASLRRVVGAPAVGRGLRLGLRALAQLRDVLLVAGVRLGVLLLPGLALGLEALLPLAGIDVEALGVDVVALGVVLGGHAVTRGVELGVDRHALVGLLERQRDPAPVQVDVDDLDHAVVADLHDLLRDLDVALGQLRDVHQALDALLDADERAERHQLGDLARHDLADRVGAGVQAPRVFLRGLERQRDPLAVEVDVEDLDRDLLADLDDLGRVVDVLPGQLGDVHEAVDAAEVHERTEVDDRGDDTGAHLALLQGLQEGGADLGLRLLEPGTAREDDVVAVLVELDDLRLDLLADVRLEVADATHLHEGGREEATEADVEDETTLDDLDDGAGDDAVLLLDLLDRAPGALVLGALLGQDQTTLLVLLLEDEGLDLVTDLDDLARVHVVLDGQLPGRDDALGLVADVEQDLVAVDLDDGALDDVAVVEVLDRGVDGGEEVLGRADVVDRDLRGAGLGGGGDAHVGMGSDADMK